MATGLPSQYWQVESREHNGPTGNKVTIESLQFGKEEESVHKEAQWKEKRKKATELPPPTQVSLLEAQGTTQEDTRVLDEVRDEAHTDRSADEQLRASQQAAEKLKADYERLRKLLYMEQRRPRIFEKECCRCLEENGCKTCCCQWHCANYDVFRQNLWFSILTGGPKCKEVIACYITILVYLFGLLHVAS